MSRDWKDLLTCVCGKRFRSHSAEAFHRHNLPVFCRKPKVKKAPKKVPGGVFTSAHQEK